jgi:phosphatidate phosphatase PAH1
MVAWRREQLIARRRALPRFAYELLSVADTRSGDHASRMRSLALLALVVCGASCAGNLRSDPYAPKTGGVIAAGPTGVPDVRCAGAPATGSARGFRSFRHTLVTKLARPNHRGTDLIATSTEPQVLRGKLAYGVIDKSLGDEDVELFACVAGAWQKLGHARTDDGGHFALELEGAKRLPVGLRDLYGSVVADRSAVRFLAYVAPEGAPIMVSDVDGTLTATESSFVKAVFLGSHVVPQPHAADALRLAAASGYQVVYMTARSDRFTDATRAWLANAGFPRGPVRLAPRLVTKPGAATAAYKRRALEGLAGFTVRALGNRRSDVAAYTAAGIPAEHIFIKLPEFGGELATSLKSGAAIGFGHYSDFKSAL